MLPLNPLASPVHALATRAQAWGQAWSRESQQTARRNALVANTALMARRRDREDVESWFARTAPRRTDDRAAHR